jgi:L-amino acid N-acyltransferase YncA
MSLHIRFVDPKDYPAVLKIYSFYIQYTQATFEITVPDIADFEVRINRIASKFPWLVCEENREIIGYAYACEHRVREAYKWSVDVSVYLNHEFTRKGYGRLLYDKLFKLLKFQGFINAYAGISLPNNASIKLHEHFEFQKVAHYSNVGYKEKWIDVGWWWKKINIPTDNPTEPLLINQFQQEELEQFF